MTHPTRLLILLLSLCSLTFAADSYTDAGFPAADREWTDVEYTQANDLIQEKTLPLPTLKNDESSALFRRMVNSLNFDRLQNKDEYPTLARLKSCLAIEKALDAIFAAYMTEAEKGAMLDAEIDHIVAATLYLTRHSVLLVEESFPQVLKDENYEKRRSALKKISARIAGQFSIVEESLDEKHASKARSYTVLLTATYDSIRIARRALKDDVRTELQRRFQKRVGEFKNPRSQELIRLIVQELAVEPALFRDTLPPSIWP